MGPSPTQPIGAARELWDGIEVSVKVMWDLDSVPTRGSQSWSCYNETEARASKFKPSAP